jgi:hypothetical protein
MKEDTGLGSFDDMQHQSDKSKKSRSVTFRLDSSVLEELQHEADQKEISLNVSVNQILKRYCQWDRYESRIGMMPVPKIILSSLIDKAISIAKANGMQNIEPYRDEIIKQAAGLAFNLMKDSVLFSVLEEYMKASGIKSDHKIEAGRKHVFLIQHELGENWSLFTKELLTLIFENLAKVRIECNITPNTTIAEVIL